VTSSTSSTDPTSNAAPTDGPAAICELRIEASPEIVFRYLTQPELMSRWLGEVVAFDPTPGGRVQILISGGHSGSGQTLEVVPNRRLSYTFGWDEPNHPIPSGSTRVDVDLTPDGSGTILRLRHSGLPADAVADHTAGHTQLLHQLADAVANDDPGQRFPTCGCPACAA
jgi:uncharacterized protein YndB with AHSA1/START domain